MRLRVLLVMDPLIPVPPLHYGGIERVVADLADELGRRGHAVTLWAAPGSRSPGSVEPFGHPGEWTRWSNARNVATLSARFFAGAARFDLVHNFGRHAYLAAVLRDPLPKVQTYMRPVDPGSVTRARRLGARRLHYTAVSQAIRDTGLAGGGAWHVVYNGAAAHRYAPRPDVDPKTAPLVLLGRLDRCKGPHTAIALARRLDRPLVLAGTISEVAAEREFFHRELEPEIDGQLVRYVGPVDDAAKAALLADAAALLLPVEWEEPFPVVLPEALMSGTPVIGFRRGGVPEGIDHGRTGFVCDTIDEMADAIARVGEIDRGVCRAEAERRFSEAAVADAYERVYAVALGRSAPGMR